MQKSMNADSRPTSHADSDQQQVRRCDLNSLRAAGDENLVHRPVDVLPTSREGFPDGKPKSPRRDSLAKERVTVHEDVHWPREQGDGFHSTTSLADAAPAQSSLARYGVVVTTAWRRAVGKSRSYPQETEKPAAPVRGRRFVRTLCAGTAGAMIAMAVQMIPGLYPVLVTAFIAGNALVLVIGLIAARR